MWNDLRMFVRFAGALNGFLQTNTTVEEARARVRQMMEARADNFLRLSGSAIFANPKSPYLALLRCAGIEFGDVERLVRSDGLEAALERLERAGVYVTLDEFRGRAPIRRPGLELPVQPSDFDNPMANRHLETRSGGSTGVARRVPFDLNQAVDTAQIEMIFFHGAGILYRPMGLYRTAPPGLAGFKKTLYQVRMGHSVERWFSEKKLTYRPAEWRFTFFIQYAHLAAGLHRKRIPLPEYTPLHEAVRVARWLAEKKANGTPAVLDVVASVGVRVARAALEAKLDISGSVFRVGSEPFTEGRAAVCREAGVTVLPLYAMSEAGVMGLACTNPNEIDEVHLLKQRLAVLQRPHRVRGSGMTVDAFYFTTLLPSSPRVLLNMESDDYGVLRSRRCGCALGELGMHTTLHSIRSYEKLTSSGVTFIGSDLYTLLETVLPSQFGGGPADYQLMEEEIEGLPRVSLVVSPRVGPLDEGRVIQAVIDFLSARDAGHRMMAQSLKQGANLGVVRREPFVTSASKIQPLHIVREAKSAVGS